MLEARLSGEKFILLVQASIEREPSLQLQTRYRGEGTSRFDLDTPRASDELKTACRSIHWLCGRKLDRGLIIGPEVAHLDCG